MEQEAREILGTVLATETQLPTNLAEELRQCFAPFGGIDLPIAAPFRE